jgi:hypothetical protein
MAQLAEGDIKVGLSRSVGRIRVDPGQIRGEAGPFDPRLVVPVSLEMQQRPAEQMIALTGLTGYLHLGESNNATTQIGLPAALNLMRGMPVRSVPGGSSPFVIDMRFQLSLAAVHRLEIARHSNPDSDFTLNLRFEGPLVWIRNTYGEARVSPRQPPPAEAEDPFGLQLGLHSDLSYFWTTDIDSLRLQIDASVWINQVLPGFGIDNVRLIEMVFPPGLPDTGNAAKVFDEALRAYHSKRYADCIGKCRGIIRAWNQQLSATSKKHLAELVGEAQRWPADDPRRKLLDSIWQALLEAANAASHPEGQDPAYQPSAHDAKLQLMMTAVVSEYLHEMNR